MQVSRIYAEYDSNGLGVLGKPELERISRDAHARGGRDCGLEMVAWRLLCARVASEAAAARGSKRVGLTQRGFRWAVRPAGANDAKFEYDMCVAVHPWQAEERRDLSFAAGARIAITSRSVPRSGWWTGYVVGSTERGSFPADHVKELPQHARQDLDRYLGCGTDETSLLGAVKETVSKSSNDSLEALAETVPAITTVHDLGKLYRTLFRAEVRQEAAICIQRHWRGVALRVFILPFEPIARRLQAAFRARLIAKRRREHAAAVQIQRVVRGRHGRAQAEVARQVCVIESMSAALRAQHAAVRKSQRRVAKRESRQKQAAAAARLHNGGVGEDRQLVDAGGGRRARPHTGFRQGQADAKHEQNRLLDNYG